LFKLIGGCTAGAARLSDDGGVASLVMPNPICVVVQRQPIKAVHWSDFRSSMGCSMEIHDISRALTNDLAPWPGDTPFHFELKWKIPEGAAVNVGAVEMGVHNGTHADAVFHFDPKGKTIEHVPLDAFIGKAVVADCKNVAPITLSNLERWEGALREAPRLLLKTDAWPDPKTFPKEIPTIARDVPHWLQERGVKLLGVDVPSVDSINSKDLHNHHALAEARIAIVESLDLSKVEAGIYNFAALPIKIAGGDAAPVRAILWRE
jgi:arylformamidase